MTPVCRLQVGGKNAKKTTRDLWIIEDHQTDKKKGVTREDGGGA